MAIRSQRRHKPTAKDVARLAGVSQTTVSFVLNDVPNVSISQETRKRVRDAAAELNYHPHVVAQNLRRRYTRTICLGISLSQNPHFWDIAQGVQDQAKSLGYTVLLGDMVPAESLDSGVFGALRRGQVDGAIWHQDPQLSDIDQVLDVIQQGYHIVTIGPLVGHTDSVQPDFAGGCLELMDYLIRLGHRRIGLIYGVNYPAAAQERLDAYYEAHRLHSLATDASLVVRCGPTQADGYAASRTLLSLRAPPTAIVAINDLLATAVLKAAYDSGVQVPGDLSVAGFDNISFSAYTCPALTTVSVDAHAVGARAAQLLIDRIHRPSAHFEHISIGARLVIRESTGQPRV